MSSSVIAALVVATTCNQLCPLIASSLQIYEITMSKKRPGVQAGINLIQQHDIDVWKRVERHYHVVRDAISSLADYEANLQAMNMSAKKEQENGPTCERTSEAGADDTTTTRNSFTKQELLEIVQWKHSVGNLRNYNLKVSSTSFCITLEQ